MISPFQGDYAGSNPAGSTFWPELAKITRNRYLCAQRQLLCKRRCGIRTLKPNRCVRNAAYRTPEGLNSDWRSTALVASEEALARVFKKRWRGEELDAEEAEAWLQYNRTYNSRRKGTRTAFHWTDEQERLEFMEAAKAANYRDFGKYCRDMIARGRNLSARTEEEWAALDQELKAANRRAMDEREVANRWLAKAEKYEAERDAYARRLADIEAAVKDAEYGRLVRA